MTSMVQVAIAGDATEAEEIQAILAEAGIEAKLEPEAEADSIAVFVPDSKVDLAQDVIEAMTEPDELDAGV
jgi:type III secretory pathway lipoprotein EscJ